MQVLKKVSPLNATRVKAYCDLIFFSEKRFQVTNGAGNILRGVSMLFAPEIIYLGCSKLYGFVGVFAVLYTLFPSLKSYTVYAKISG